MRQWAENHDKSDDFRFAIVWRVFAGGAALFIALTSWSLKTQYDTLQAQLTQARETQTVVQQTGAQVVNQVRAMAAKPQTQPQTQPGD